jgi:sugar lactone lactonase YvrE
MPHYRWTAAQPAKPFQRLAITDYAGGAVKIFDSTYHLTSTITDGIVHPLGDAYDASGKLYVSNCVSGTCAQAQGPNVVDVNEYDRSGNLIFSYSHGLVLPFGVAVDAAGNVYVADGGLGRPSRVLEYRQQQKRPIATCFTGLSNTGVAVDAGGDVFVSGDSSERGGGYLREHKRGLAGCKPYVPRITLGFAGGLRVDRQNRLVACDQNVGVDVISPPYKTVGSTIALTANSRDAAINNANTLVFIVDAISAAVVVGTYPDGKYVTTLNGSGLSQPLGAATYP